MITGDVIKRVERQRPGCNMSVEDYISFLNILEEEIYSNIIARHEGDCPFVPHSGEEDELMLPDRYADIYCFYLFARIDLINGDVVGYTNNMILYNNLLDEFSRYYTRAHMPKVTGRIRWR